MENKDEIVNKAVSDLLQKHHLQDDIECIDEVVLSYVLSILEDLGNDENPEDNIDVDQFIEMMTAYIPGFSQIESVEIYEWMFKIASVLSSQSSQSSQSKTNSTNHTKPKESAHSAVSNGLCNGHQSSQKKSKPRSRKSSQSSSESNTTIDKQKCDPSDIRMLLEMFPASCNIEVKHCLKLCLGNLEETAQLILQRQEKGTSLKSKSDSASKKSEPKTSCLEPDPSVKDHVLAKYSFVDTEEDVKTYRPPPIKQEPKKLLRYLDNKVVNTKGQKFTEIKKHEDEDMKKTYVSLKPAKQYRFH